MRSPGADRPVRSRRGRTEPSGRGQVRAEDATVATGRGALFREEARENESTVAATGRDATTLNDLVTAHGDAELPLQRDVTDKTAAYAAPACPAR